MNMHKILIAAATLALALTLPASSHAQFGGLLKKAGGGGGDAGAADGAALLKQLTPGAVKFNQAYAKYYESLGDTTNAANMKAQADQLEKGGSLTKEQSALMDENRKKIAAAAKTAGASDDAAKAKWKEANGLYAQGLLEWGAVSTAVALALKNNPSAALTQPELGLAAGLCVKGMKDLTGFLQIAKARSGTQGELDKAAK